MSHVLSKHQLRFPTKPSYRPHVPRSFQAGPFCIHHHSSHSVKALPATETKDPLSQLQHQSKCSPDLYTIYCHRRTKIDARLETNSMGRAKSVASQQVGLGKMERGEEKWSYNCGICNTCLRTPTWTKRSSLPFASHGLPPRLVSATAACARSRGLTSTVSHVD
jgi:hypothetical protein